MLRRLFIASLWMSCAEVPAAVCFSDEPCAAPTNTGGGVATGGGASRDGGASGGGGGGGATSSGDAGTGGGTIVPSGWTRPTGFPAPSFSETWAQTVAHLGPPIDVSTAHLDPPTVLTVNTANSCPELFRGAVALPNGHVLAVPFCAERFVDVEPTIDGGAQEVGTPITAPTAARGEPRARFGGAVLGFDGRVYALPYQLSSVFRLELISNRNFSPTFMTTQEATTGAELRNGLDLSGGVVVGSRDAFQIVAAGQDGLHVFDVYEQGVLHRLIETPESHGRRFEGVARIGDDLVISTPAPSSPSGGPGLALLVDVKTWAVVGQPTLLNLSATDVVRGLASLTDGGVFFVSKEGRAGTFTRSDGWLISPTIAAMGADHRWIANSLVGWVYSSGNDPSLRGWVDLFHPVPFFVGAASGRRSGGLIVTPAGFVVDVSSDELRPAFFVYRPTSLDAGVEVLGPWFNKL